MAYHTALYLFLFLPLSLLIYYVTPIKKRWVSLLLTGYLFFSLISKELIIYLLGITLYTHYIGMQLMCTKERCAEDLKGIPDREKAAVKSVYRHKEKKILAAGIFGLLGILFYLKYYNFFMEGVNDILKNLGNYSSLETKNILIPIGISFYTLQAIGYMSDVYYGRIKEWQPLGKVAVYLAFFPQLMEGPICLYGQTADQLYEGNVCRESNLSGGAVRIVWGLFKKIIIADRLNILVNELFTNYSQYSGIMIVIAAIAYTMQLYMEFSGCMDIIIGSGRMFGITLPENFRQPFCSKSAAEFWKRWHITLGVWFKTYVFYPMSVSRIVKNWSRWAKKHCSKYIMKLGVSALCLMPVWLCNGLWHGAKWNYIFYGIYYFAILMLEIGLEPVRSAALRILHVKETSWGYKLYCTMRTWIVIFTGELFFRANGLAEGIAMFRSIFQKWEIHKLWDGTMLSMGLDQADYLIIIVCSVVVFVVGFIKERNLLGNAGLYRFGRSFRWALYYCLILSVIIFGAYGTGYQQVDMIYAGF